MQISMNCERRQKLEMIALTVLRVVVGYIMVVHGYQKIGIIPQFQENLAGMGLPFPAVMARLAVAGEFLGGLGLIVGALTPLAAFGIFATMFVAVTKVHWSNGLLAQNNGFEYPLTLGLVALYFMVRGAGCISIDALVCKIRNKRKLVE